MTNNFTIIMFAIWITAAPAAGHSSDKQCKVDEDLLNAIENSRTLSAMVIADGDTSQNNLTFAVDVPTNIGGECFRVICQRNWLWSGILVLDESGVPAMWSPNKGSVICDAGSRSGLAAANRIGIQISLAPGRVFPGLAISTSATDTSYKVHSQSREIMSRSVRCSFNRHSRSALIDMPDSRAVVILTRPYGCDALSGGHSTVESIDFFDSNLRLARVGGDIPVRLFQVLSLDSPWLIDLTRVNLSDPLWREMRAAPARVPVDAHPFRLFAALADGASEKTASSRSRMWSLVCERQSGFRSEAMAMAASIPDLSEDIEPAFVEPFLTAAQRLFDHVWEDMVKNERPESDSTNLTLFSRGVLRDHSSFLVGRTRVDSLVQTLIHVATSSRLTHSTRAHALSILFRIGVTSGEWAGIASSVGVESDPRSAVLANTVALASGMPAIKVEKSDFTDIPPDASHHEFLILSETLVMLGDTRWLADNEATFLRHFRMCSRADSLRLITLMAMSGCFNVPLASRLCAGDDLPLDVHDIVGTLARYSDRWTGRLAHSTRNLDAPRARECLMPVCREILFDRNVTSHRRTDAGVLLQIIESAVNTDDITASATFHKALLALWNSENTDDRAVALRLIPLLRDRKGSVGIILDGWQSNAPDVVASACDAAIRIRRRDRTDPHMSEVFSKMLNGSLTHGRMNCLESELRLMVEAHETVPKLLAARIVNKLRAGSSRDEYRLGFKLVSLKSHGAFSAAEILKKFPPDPFESQEQWLDRNVDVIRSEMQKHLGP